MYFRKEMPPDAADTNRRQERSDGSSPSVLPNKRISDYKAL